LFINILVRFLSAEEGTVSLARRQAQINCNNRMLYSSKEGMHSVASRKKPSAFTGILLSFPCVGKRAVVKDRCPSRSEGRIVESHFISRRRSLSSRNTSSLKEMSKSRTVSIGTRLAFLFIVLIALYFVISGSLVGCFSASRVHSRTLRSALSRVFSAS